MSKNLYKPIVIFLLSNTLVFGNLINGFYFSNKSNTSNASNLNGKNIYINTDEKLSTNTNVIGSNVIADENLYINTNNLNVKASQDNYTSKNDSESINGSIAFT
ncbi:hemagglutinin repeat-containing protein, partial [Aliarcobacter butzleri]